MASGCGPFSLEGCVHHWRGEPREIRDRLAEPPGRACSEIYILKSFELEENTLGMVGHAKRSFDSNELARLAQSTSGLRLIDRRPWTTRQGG